MPLNGEHHRGSVLHTVSISVSHAMWDQQKIYRPKRFLSAPDPLSQVQSIGTCQLHRTCGLFQGLLLCTMNSYELKAFRLRFTVPADSMVIPFENGLRKFEQTQKFLTKQLSHQTNTYQVY